MPSGPYTGLGVHKSVVVLTVIAESIHRDSYKWFWEFGSVSAEFGCAKFMKDLRNWALLAEPPCQYTAQHVSDYNDCRTVAKTACQYASIN